jgi:hypothetical protein
MEWCCQGCQAIEQRNQLAHLKWANPARLVMVVEPYRIHCRV